MRSTSSDVQSRNAVSDAIFISGGSVYVQNQRDRGLEPSNSGGDPTPVDHAEKGFANEKVRVDRY